MECEEFKKDVKNGTVKKKPWRDFKTDQKDTKKVKPEEVKKVVEDDWDDDDGIYCVAETEKEEILRIGVKVMALTFV